ncbi:MAG: hypothetical protein ABI645_00540 [Pseudomonadota bacterium]
MKTTTKKLGLYQIKKVSYELDELASSATSGTLEVTPPIDEMMAWVTEVQNQALKMSKSRKQTASVRASAKRCASPAFLALNFLRKAKAHKSLPAFEVAQAMRAAAELADEWHSVGVNAAFEKPIAARELSTSTGNANIEGAAKREREKADSAAKKNVEDWAANPSRRAECEKLSWAEKIDKYLKVARPTDRLARRLRIMRDQASSQV